MSQYQIRTETATNRNRCSCFEAMINKTETWTGNLFPDTSFFFQTFQGVLASLNEQQVYLYLPWPARALIFWRLNPWRNSRLSQ